jgi:hypothetical protein
MFKVFWDVSPCRLVIVTWSGSSTLGLLHPEDEYNTKTRTDSNYAANYTASHSIADETLAKALPEPQNSVC